MKAIHATLIFLLLLLATPAHALALAAAGEDDNVSAAAYLEFRRWFDAQSEDVRGGDVLAAYRAHLTARGLNGEMIEQRIKLIREGRQSQEVAMWNRVLTAVNPRFNTAPNYFMVRMVEGRRPGRALDVGMGQGRNAIWLAGQGWDVTGFDPAEKAIALAQKLAAEAGVKITTKTVGSEEFEWGRERWDLIILSYVSVREWIDTIHQALAPGGIIVLEAFHSDATENASIGRGVVFETNELLELFSGFRILHYEDLMTTADFGQGEMRVVRLLAAKE